VAAEPASLQEATALETNGSGSYTLTLSESWWLIRGASGAYLSAVMLRALSSTLDQPDFRPLSFVAHFVAPTRPGSAVIDVVIDRRGSRTASVSARMSQGDVVVVTASAAFGRNLGGRSLDNRTPPKVTPAAECAELEIRPEVRAKFPLTGRFVRRRPSAADRETVGTGGWIRFAEATPVSYMALLALLDAWVPAVSSQFQETIGMSTLSYFVEFQADLSGLDFAPDEFILAAFAGEWSAQGYAEDGGELWTGGGRLLARSRQVLMIATN
jgi:acyl-CoA thioesterase